MRRLAALAHRLTCALLIAGTVLALAPASVGSAAGGATHEDHFFNPAAQIDRSQIAVMVSVTEWEPPFEGWEYLP